MQKQGCVVFPHSHTCACSCPPSMDFQVFETNPISHWSDLSKCYPGYKIGFSLRHKEHTRTYRHTRILSTPTKHTKHKQQTQQIRKCIEETQKHPQLWGRLPNQKLQVIWAAAACVWVDACIVVCSVQCLVDELMPDGIVCDCR